MTATAPQSKIENQKSKIPTLDPQAIAATAALAEHRLNLWLSFNPNPSLDQLNLASQALWRIAAVHKTLFLLANPPAQKAKRRKAADAFPRELVQLMQEIDLLMDLIKPLSTGAAARPRAASSSPSRDCSMRVPSSLTRPFWWPEPETSRVAADARHAMPNTPAASSPKASSGVGHSNNKNPGSKDNPPNPPACPQLRQPLHTAQTALRQVDRLCRQDHMPEPEKLLAPLMTDEEASHNALLLPESPAASTSPADSETVVTETATEEPIVPFTAAPRPPASRHPQILKLASSILNSSIPLSRHPPPKS